MSVLTCPVCQATMREINRSGVLIDTCTQCRGVWLDRGELEKLSSLVGPREAAGHPDLSAGPYPNQRRYRDDDDDDDDDDRRRRGGGSNPRGSRRSFLDFFD